VYEKKTVSVLQLQGNKNEIGTYECWWNNSRGEARQKRFTASFAEELPMETTTSTIITAFYVIMIAIVAIGIGTKFYLEKVSDLN
jgi:hypothetical protein